MPAAQSALAYLLRDVAVGDGDRAGGPVEEVLVRGDLTRLHGTRAAQLLHTDGEE